MARVTVSEVDELSNKIERDLQKTAHDAAKDQNLLKEILEGIVSTNDSYRHNCFKVLAIVGEKYPKILYPEWKRFEVLLSSGNAFHRAIAVNMITILARVDKKERFEKMFRRYFNLLNDESLMVARYVAKNANDLARSKPGLLDKIVSQLLRLERDSHFDSKRRDLILSDALESFEDNFEENRSKKGMIKLARILKDSGSPRAKKVAGHFLDKFGSIESER